MLSSSFGGLLLIFHVILISCTHIEINLENGAQCLEGWSMFEGQNSTNCYNIILTPHLSFTDAEAHCMKIAPGAHLASFHSPEEYTFIKELQQRVAPTENATSWIGMSHTSIPFETVPLGGKNRFQLSFLDNSTMFDFTGMDDDEYGKYWGYSGFFKQWEPNGGWGDQCIELMQRYFYAMDGTPHMNDDSCSQQKGFICKYTPFTRQSSTSKSSTMPFTITTPPKPSPIDSSLPMQGAPSYMVLPIPYGWKNGYNVRVEPLGNDTGGHDDDQSVGREML